MYRGYSISIFCIPVFNALYFPLYEHTKDKLKHNLGWQENQVRLYSTGAGIAGFTCNLITNPLWLVRTRMQVEIFKDPSNEHFRRKYSHGMLSMFQNIRNIYT